MEKVGLRFSHQTGHFGGQKGPLSQIDGYLQLMRYAQKNEEQKNKIQQLEDTIYQFNDKTKRALQA